MISSICILAGDAYNTGCMSFTKKNPDGTKVAEVIEEKLRRRKKVQFPTKRQIKFVEYVKKGLSQRQAALKAGYSPSLAQSVMQIRKSPQVAIMLDAMREEMLKQGLTAQKMATKMSEWMDAKQERIGKDGEVVVTKDYKTQISAYDRWKDIMQPKESKNPGSGKKITLEEWVEG